MAGLQDFLQGASNSVASNVSAPVDGLAWLLRKAGVPIPSNPVGGSDWMAQQGFTREPESRNMGLLGESIGGVAPMLVAAKAPQIARGLLSLDDTAMDMTRRGIEGYMDKTGMRQNIFIGPSSKTWDTAAAAKAQQLMDAGTDARKIWSETGTWRGPDGAWRQEIPDNAANLTDINTLLDNGRPSINSELESLVKSVKAKGGKPTEADKAQAKMLHMRHASTSYEGDIAGALKHDDLYGAYPEAAKTNFQWTPMPTGAHGEYSPSGLLLNSGISGKDAKSTTLHELQHAIQQREGFARGGSPEMFADTMPYESLVKRSSSQQDAYIRAKAAGGVDPETGLSLGGLKQSIDDLSGQIQSWKSPHEQYMHLAGEAEARATQARIPLDAAQRRALFPEDSYDVPINQLIMRGVGR